MVTLVSVIAKYDVDGYTYYTILEIPQNENTGEMNSRYGLPS